MEVRLVEADPPLGPGGRRGTAGRTTRRPSPPGGRRGAPRRRPPIPTRSWPAAASCCWSRRPTCSTTCGPPVPRSWPWPSTARRPCPGTPGTPDDDDLVVVAARRTTFEAALRRGAQRRPEIEVVLGPQGRRPGGRAGHRCSPGRGVDVRRRRPRLRRRGRRRHRPPEPDAGLAEAGRACRSMDDSSSAASRTSPASTGAARGARAAARPGATAGGSFDRYSCLVFPGDAGTFSVTFGILPEDRTLRRPADSPAFDAAVRAIPPPGAMAGRRDGSDLRRPDDGGLTNSIRRTTEAGAPGVLGWTAVGDAAATTNPAHSRGCTLAVLHATGVADAIAEHARRPGRRPRRPGRGVRGGGRARPAPVGRRLDRAGPHRLARWRSVDGHWHTPHARAGCATARPTAPPSTTPTCGGGSPASSSCSTSPGGRAGRPAGGGAGAGGAGGSGVVTEALEVLKDSCGQLVELLSGCDGGGGAPAG